MKTLKSTIAAAHDTTENWNRFRQFIPAAGEIIIYDDRYTDVDENDEIRIIPGIKIGDGKAYLIDLPFIDDYSSYADISSEKIRQILLEHEYNTTMHVNQEEKAFWNNKVSCNILGETLIFTTE